MSRYHTCLTYAVSFVVADAKHSTGSETTVQIKSQAQKEPWTITCKRNTELRRLLSRNNRNKEEANTENRKTSKLIAYISTRPCKIISIKVQYYVKAR